MMRRISLAVVLVALFAALLIAQHRREAAPVSGQSLLYLVADSERDLTTMPAHFTRISDADEIKYGDVMAHQMSDASEKLDPDEQRIAQYVAEVGKRVASKARRRLPYRFHYVRDRRFVNAFALPGGHVFIGGGLIDRMTSEDALASVIAHEIEHVDHYHCAERLQVEAALRKIPLGGIAAIPIGVFQMGYGKDQELEADREGVLLASRGGYSANGALEAFEMLARLYAPPQQSPRTPQGETAAVAADVLTGYFRSHPLPPERVAQVRTMIAQQPSLAAPAETRLRVDYIVLAWHALEALANDKFAAARDDASRSLARQPGHPTALQALAEAQLALGQFAEAETTYRDLLARDEAKADTVEKWAAQRVQTLYDAKDYDRALALAHSALTVQPGQPPLLRLVAFSSAMKGDSAGAVAAGANLQKLYPDVATQTAGDAEGEATKLLSAAEFDKSIAMANLALALDAKRKSALAARGAAEIAQARFADAAKTYADQFDRDNSDAAWLNAYAIAVAAARPQNAATELQSLIGSSDVRQIPDGAIRVQRAGLALVGGSEAETLDALQRVKSASLAPELLPSLAWWAMQAHRPDMATTVLTTARQLRPGDAEVQNALAWLALEAGKPADAIVASESQSADAVRLNGRDVREALAAWQQGRASDAVRAWSQVVQNQPQWRNPAWRAALYPPRINATAAAIEAERERRAALTVAVR